MDDNNAPQPDPGSYIVLNGQRLDVVHHPTDFSVIAPLSVVSAQLMSEDTPGRPTLERLTGNQTRVRMEDPQVRDTAMEEVRRSEVAHHIYSLPDTGEEIVIDNRILLTLRFEDPAVLEAIIQEFHLQQEGRLGDAHVLRVTSATGMNPLKAANLIAQRPEVASCMPQVLVPMQLHEAPLTDRYRLFRQQWYLSSELTGSHDVHPNAGIQAPEAWQVTVGDPSIVIAVVDDGFDLDHPAFRGKTIHPAARDFGVLPMDGNPRPDADDYHGTCVASIATGALAGDAMLGVAPGCTFLPIRIAFGRMAPPIDILEVFRYASRFADVVNCSFGTPPSSFDPFPAAFRQELSALARTGGRRGKGLVMVFSAANDDAPTSLSAAQNVNGVRFVQNGRLVHLPAGRQVFSGYPMTPGVVVVGAMSSLRRKAGYSCWGPHLTVTAPSNNLHYITSFLPVGTPGRADFVANYRGLGQIAATNRPGNGAAFSPLVDDPATPDLRENFYTRSFGGTSGAAPVVTGVVALMLSVNPALTAAEVRQILMATADQDLDPTLDLALDPNVQGLTGEFINGRSLWFGSGKVNAKRAVKRAAALHGPSAVPAPAALASPGYPAAPLQVPFALSASPLAGSLLHGGDPCELPPATAGLCPCRQREGAPVLGSVLGSVLSTAQGSAECCVPEGGPAELAMRLSPMASMTPMAPFTFTGMIQHYPRDQVSTFTDQQNGRTSYLVNTPPPGVWPGMVHVHQAHQRLQRFLSGSVITLAGAPGSITDSFGRPWSALFI